MYNKARDIGYTGDNPAKGIKKFKEEKRDRFLHGDELPAFFKALASEPNDLLRDFFLTALLTGARRANVQAMRWDDLDLDRGSWRIPGSEAKAGETIGTAPRRAGPRNLGGPLQGPEAFPVGFPELGCHWPPRGTQGRLEANLQEGRTGQRSESTIYDGPSEAGRLWAELPCRSSARASVTPRSRRRPSTPAFQWTQYGQA